MALLLTRYAIRMDWLLGIIGYGFSEFWDWAMDAAIRRHGWIGGVAVALSPFLLAALLVGSLILLLR